jgi:hypothetical protein
MKTSKFFKNPGALVIVANGFADDLGLTLLELYGGRQNPYSTELALRGGGPLLSRLATSRLVFQRFFHAKILAFRKPSEKR